MLILRQGSDFQESRPLSMECHPMLLENLWKWEAKLEVRSHLRVRRTLRLSFLFPDTNIIGKEESCK